MAFKDSLFCKYLVSRVIKVFMNTMVKHTLNNASPKNGFWYERINIKMLQIVRRMIILAKKRNIQIRIAKKKKS